MIVVDNNLLFLFFKLHMSVINVYVIFDFSLKTSITLIAEIDTSFSTVVMSCELYNWGWIATLGHPGRCLISESKFIVISQTKFRVPASVLLF